MTYFPPLLLLVLPFLPYFWVSRIRTEERDLEKVGLKSLSLVLLGVSCLTLAGRHVLCYGSHLNTGSFLGHFCGFFDGPYGVLYTTQFPDVGDVVSPRPLVNLTPSLC